MDIIGGSKRMIKDIFQHNFSIPKKYVLEQTAGRLFVAKKGSLLIPKVELTVTPEGIETVVGNKKSYYERNSIKQLFYKGYFVMRQTEVNFIFNKVLVYDLEMVVSDASGDRRVELLKAVPSGYFTRFIEQESEKILCIDDCLVEGEYDFNKKSNNDISAPDAKAVGFSKNSAEVVFERKNDPNIANADMYKISLIIVAAVILLLISDSMPVALVFTALSCIFYFWQFKKDTLSINDNCFEVVKRNTFGMKKTVLSAKLSEIDYVRSFEKAPDSDRQNSCFMINVVFKNNSRPPMSLFNNVDAHSAEFIADTVNIELESKNGFGL